MRSRLNKVLRKYAIILGIGLGYLIFVLATGIRIPCLFYVATGFQCPGCGITRMFVELFRGNFVLAFKFNPFVFICLPLLLIYIVFCDINYVRTDKATLGKLCFLPWMILVGAFVFGVLRNIL